jgi:hypothetical protein
MSLREFTQMTIGLLFLITPQVAAAQAPTGIGSNIPILASGTVAPVVPVEEEMPANVFQGSVTVSGSYDDNVFGGGTPRIWDVDYGVTPAVTFQETRPRLDFSLTYSPGLQVSQRLLYRDVFAQKFAGTVVWLVSPHGTLSAQQYYDVTINPFAGTNVTNEPGPLIAPNEAIYIPNIRQSLILSHALYSYQSSARTVMGVGGSYESQKFDSTPESGPTTSLIYAQIATGEAYIAKQLTGRNQLGFQYGLQVLKFPQADARTTTHSFLVFDQMNLSSRTNLTLYGGPEYSLTANQVVLNLGFVLITIPVTANTWSGAGGVMYNWTGDRLAAAVNFSRRVSNGGQLVGAVELTSGTASLNWQLTRSWSLTSGIAGANEQLLGESGEQLTTYSGRFGVRRQLGRDLRINWYYERLNQTGSIGNFLVGNRDIAGVSLEYGFMRPVGR